MYLTPPPAVMHAQRDALSAGAWLLIALAVLAPFAMYFDTVRSIIAIWDSSETYAHGYAILPICLWLIWGRRDQLRGMPVTPFWPALVLIGLCGMAWLLAEMAEVQVVRQYAFAAMLPLCALAILGMPIARQLAFPLLFILFAVPFGDVFIDPLINITADFTVRAIEATGIPIYREGNNFTLPSGNWSVVEACSGVRYLISSVTLGSLYAYLTYRSPWRRDLFVLMSIIVPIVANGLRAYMIVMIGHLSGMTLAVGVDHLIYGWLFFGLVMFLLFWIGSLWREDDKAVATSATQEGATLAAGTSTMRLALAAVATVVVAGIWPGYNYALQHDTSPAAPVDLSQMKLSSPTAAQANGWRSAFPAAAGELYGSYDAGGRTVDLEVRYYRKPPEGTKLITTSNRMAATGDQLWRARSMQLRDENIGGRALRVRESVIAGPGRHVLVWHWYWIDGANTSSDYHGKLLQLRQKLSHSSDDGAVLMFSTAYDEDREPARAAMRAFLARDLAAIEAVLAANSGR